MTKIDIISGFLGAGKTTLIKKLLKEAFAGQQIVLIENEFGEIGIDGGFLKDAGIQITEMNSGCICCSLVGDFGEALKQVVGTYHPDRIIIEPSGVGKLSDVIAAVANTAEEIAIELNNFVTVADANKCRMYMKNFGEFYNNQIESANTVILSRTQGMNEEKLQTAVSLIQAKNEKAKIITTPWDELTGEQILAVMEQGQSLTEELLKEALEAHAREQEAHDRHHDHDGECSCGHHHDEEHEHDHHHDHDGECSCGHHHDEEHDHHDHHHDHDGECSCGHHHDEEHDHHHDHHDHDGECSCGHHHDEEHDHHHDHHDHDGECSCGHHHDEEHDHHDHDGECSCGHHHDEEHDHHHDHHDHDGECSCGHHHDEEHDHHHHHHDHDGACSCGHHHHHADEVFTSWGRETPKKFDRSAMEEILKALAETEEYGIILRAKGMVPDTAGEWMYFDLVPGEYEIRTGTPDYTGRLCVIGSGLKEDRLAELFGL